MTFHQRLPLPTLLLPLAVACAPHIQVEVLQPAMITMPAEIETLVVIDRSAPKNAGQTVLGVLEGAVTGEAVLGDREGAQKAVEQLHYNLDRSPRFDAVIVPLTKDQADSDIFAKELSWKAAQRIAKKADADAVVSLEAFDSDSVLTFSTEVETYTEDGEEKRRTVHIAQRESTVLTAWRVYDVQNKQLLDDVREHRYADTWTQRAGTREAAIAALPQQYQTITTLGGVAGVDYARRIAPSYIWVSRSYYGKGHDRLKEGKNHVKAQDWEGAAAIWTKMVKNQNDPKTRGKAHYNLALYYETTGELEPALDHAKQAAVDLHNKRSRNYSYVLSQRLADQRLLEEQMKKAEPAKKPEGVQRAGQGESGARESGSGTTRTTGSGGTRTRPE